MKISSVPKLISLANDLGATPSADWSQHELDCFTKASKSFAPLSKTELALVRESICSGEDILGSAYQSIQSSKDKRHAGAIYTPDRLVTTMCDWAAKQGKFSRIIEPGCGSARFLMRAAKDHPRALLVGIDTDPVATILARANMRCIGAAPRTKILNDDFLSIALPRRRGRTLFIGNPPYVRHHSLSRETKDWFGKACKDLGIKASKLSGLHVLFYVATLLHSREGDCGSFVTSGEWLEVNYGSALRKLFLESLGGRRIIILDQEANPFPGTLTTATITTFEPGAQPAVVGLQEVKNLHDFRDMRGGRTVAAKTLASATKWPPKTSKASALPAEFIELGELFRVHRGQVTGANKVWIANAATPPVPDRFYFKCVTRAQEVIRAGSILADSSALRDVIDLPSDLGTLAEDERELVDDFLRYAMQMKAHESYIAQHRKPWWRVNMRAPAAVLATYMARREPSFVINAAKARHINVAHGLYPREEIQSDQLAAIICYLNGAQSRHIGRTYAGGLTKFEPSEMSRIPIPSPAIAKDIAVA